MPPGVGPVARQFDMVMYPSCGAYPIVTGNPLWLEAGLPVAHLGAIVACPGGGWIASGSMTLLNSSIPTARLFELAGSIRCGAGFIMTASPLWMES